MATLSFYSLDDEQMQKHCTYTFEAILYELLKHGELTEDHVQKILAKYAPIHAKRGLFGRAMDAIFTSNSDDKQTQFYVKLVEIKR